MLKAMTLCCACALLILAGIPAQAVQDDRVGHGAAVGGGYGGFRSQDHARAGKRGKAPLAALNATAKPQKVARARSTVEVISTLPHPPGCPRTAFCACGAAVELFGSAIRSLWPVSAWRKYPRDIARPDNVVFEHYSHLSVLKRQVSGTVWEVHNYNGNKHQSSVQRKDIAGLEVRNPHASRHAKNSQD